MIAKKAVKRFGKKLIGMTLRTEPMGDWPGGLVKVKMVYPDKRLDPEVPIWIRSLEGQKPRETGVIEHENIEII